MDPYTLQKSCLKDLDTFRLLISFTAYPSPILNQNRNRVEGTRGTVWGSTMTHFGTRNLYWIVVVLLAVEFWAKACVIRIQ